MSDYKTNSPLKPQYIEVPDYGRCIFPQEFHTFTGMIDSVEVHDARESAKELHNLLAHSAAIVLTGTYLYVNGVYRYCMRYERELVSDETFSHISNPAQRNAAFAAERRRKLHHLLLLAKGDELIDIQNPPDTQGLQNWLQEPTGDDIFLIPLRRLQRIFTDMRRAQEGIYVNLLKGFISILPHVYVPTDTSVPAMFVKCRDIIKDKRILDMGTGTGILAILAAKLGASKVIATDNNPYAVSNAKLNVEKFGLSDKVEVRGPADLFDSVAGEKFDVILFNAPWIQGEPQTLYDTANYDPGFRIIDGFMQEVCQYLEDSGKLLLQYSDVSQRKGDKSIDHLYDMIKLNGLEVWDKQSIGRVSRVIGTQERVFLFEIQKDDGDKDYGR